MVWMQKWRNNRLFSPFVIELLIIMFVVEFVKGSLTFNHFTGLYENDIRCFCIYYWLDASCPIYW